jgi:hypothetical protein
MRLWLALFFLSFALPAYSAIDLNEEFQSRRVERKTRREQKFDRLESRRQRDEALFPGSYLAPRLGFEGGAVYIPTFGLGPVDGTSTTSLGAAQPSVGVQFGFGRFRWLVFADIDVSPFAGVSPTFAEITPIQISTSISAAYRVSDWFYVGGGLVPFRNYRVKYASGQVISSLGIGVKLSASARLGGPIATSPRLFADFSAGRYAGVRTALNGSSGNQAMTDVVKSGGFTGWALFTVGIQLDLVFERL